MSDNDEECPMCGEPVKLSYDLTEEGSERSRVPESVKDICVDVYYHTEHEVEMTMYCH